MSGRRLRLELDTRGGEWLSYSDRTEVRAMPLPLSLANLKREISVKKWVEARQRAGGRTSKKKHRLAESHKPDSTAAASTKRLAPRYCQAPAENRGRPHRAICSGQRLGPPPSAGGAAAPRRQ